MADEVKNYKIEVNTVVEQAVKEKSIHKMSAVEKAKYYKELYEKAKNENAELVETINRLNKIIEDLQNIIDNNVKPELDDSSYDDVSEDIENG